MNMIALAALRDYWEDLRNGRLAPYRAELDPRKFEDTLEHMFILEQLNPSQIRVRLAGMALCEMMGMEVRGMPPEAFFSAQHRAAFQQHLNAVLTAPAVVELDLISRDEAGMQTKAQMLLLPLRSDFGEVTRVLGCAITERRSANPPVNFEIIGQRTTVITPTREADAGGPSQMPGFAEAQTAFRDVAGSPAPGLRAVCTNDTPEVATPRRRGHLKLVDGS